MFPLTRHSVLLSIASPEEPQRRRGLEVLAEAYWRPVYKYLRLRWGAAAEEAEDLTQGFFARALEKGFFAQYDPQRARFRTWLRTCLDGFVSNERAAARRLKRGGGAALLPLDFAEAEAELAGSAAWPEADVEERFRREWVRALFAGAVAELQEECRAAGKGVRFALFERYDLDPPPEGRPTYAQLAGDFALPVTQVTNHLSAVRRDFRRLVLARLRAATGSEDEFRAEARDLLGGMPP
jgi:DNA-directed RNA polymerase specialized sigma24 family protein